MKKPIIAVDIDDVLADSARAFVAFSNQMWGLNLTEDDFDEDYGKVWGTDRSETERRALQFHDPKVFDAFVPNPDAYTVLQGLKKSYDLVVATSRRQTMRVVTQDWLNRHYDGIFKGVYFSGIYDGEIVPGRFMQTKAELLISLGVHYLIDDQLKHCIAAAEEGKEALLMGDRRWNQHPALPPNVTRCKDWQAVAEYFGV